MSPAVQDILFRGAFPVNCVHGHVADRSCTMGCADEIEQFVEVVAGQRLSVREIELLAHGYFRGPASQRWGDRPG